MPTLRLNLTVVCSLLFSALAIGLSPDVAEASTTCTRQVDLFQNTPSAVRVASVLHHYGISEYTGSSAGKCQPVTARVSDTVDGRLQVSVRNADGISDVRTVYTPEAAAIWIESWVRQDRLEGLLDEPTSLSVPDSITIYESIDDWLNQLPDGRIQADLLHHQRGRKRGLESMYYVDLSRREARQFARVSVFTVGDSVYINDDQPRMYRRQLYSKLEVSNDRGVFKHLHCYRSGVSTPGGRSRWTCDMQVKLLDLTTGETEVINRRKMKRWLEAYPELYAAYAEDNRKEVDVLWMYGIRMIHARAARRE